ncbi:MAG TPA: SDR family NAD(P)-dependent oxidoreductase [Solirubrobacteraceae bacterium]|jgi:NAD(P)-dependent dehydrogenase (short-subunit alcohol dehydrogenase family)
MTRTAVVTGGASGIGQAFAVRLARDGHRVVIADLAPAAETLDALAGDGHAAVRCDVSSPDDVAALQERCGHCDVLVANAGIYPVAPFEDVGWEDWRRVMAVNLDSLFHLANAFLPGMRAAGWGRIVALVSNGFHTGLPGLTPYVASKGGVIGFVRSLAGEVGADGVTVNALAPGLTRTPGTLAGPQVDWYDSVAATQAIPRTETPDDLTGALAFLVSDEAGFITGQTLAVDGGQVRG